MTKLFDRVKRSTVSETIVEQVKELIIDGQLTAGQKLPSERELAQELRVGRSFRTRSDQRFGGHGRGPGPAG